jgi:hypothetical protein
MDIPNWASELAKEVIQRVGGKKMTGTFYAICRFCLSRVYYPDKYVDACPICGSTGGEDDFKDILL